MLMPESKDCIDHILEKVPKEDLYCQLAEEAAELAQAANKMARIIRGSNPTPKNESEVYKNVVEEFTDVFSVASVLDIHVDDLILNYKLRRWSQRLENDSRYKQASI